MINENYWYGKKIMMAKKPNSLYLFKSDINVTIKDIKNDRIIRK
jgi:hypothetical protein